MLKISYLIFLDFCLLRLEHSKIPSTFASENQNKGVISNPITMKRFIVSLLVIVSTMIGVDVAVCNAQEFVTSPDGAVKVTVGVKSKQAFYEVSFHGKEVVSPSRLGFLLADGETGTHARMGAVSRSSKDETWQQLWGEEDTARNHDNELTVNYKEQTGHTMQVVFRVFNDGFGFLFVALGA